MRVLLQDLATFSRELRRIFEAQEIHTTEDVKRFVEGRVVLPIVKTPYWVAFDKRVSNGAAEAYAVSYTSPGPFTPLQVRFNPRLQYTKIFARSQQPIAGYVPFDKDGEGNIAWERVMPGTEVASLKRALAELDIPLSV